jgi:hypothetical protein
MAKYLPPLDVPVPAQGAVNATPKVLTIEAPTAGILDNQINLQFETWLQTPKKHYAIRDIQFSHNGTGVNFLYVAHISYVELEV